MRWFNMGMSYPTRHPVAADPVSVVDTFSRGTSGSGTITRTGLDFGANVAGRIIVIGFTMGTPISRTLSSVTIGGVAATAVQSTFVGSVSQGTALFYAQPTGTTGQSVTVAFSQSIAQYSSVIWRAEVVTTTPYDSAKSTTPGVTTTVNVDILPGGLLFLSGRSQGPVLGAHSYNGVDTVVDDFMAVVNASTLAQCHVSVTETASRNIGLTGGTSGAGKHIAAASWL